MKVCQQCGKKGFFLKLDQSGICFECVENNIRLDKCKKLGEAKRFIGEFTPYIKTALGRHVVLPSFGRESLLEQKRACDYVCEHIDDWKQYEYFDNAIKETCITDDRGQKIHPMLRNSIISEFVKSNYDEIFEKIKKDASRLSTACYLASLDAYDYSKIFTVAGVTFKNGRRHRQTILRQIKFHDSPYKRTPTFHLKKYLFEGEDAVAVYADEEQVGNISKTDLPWLLDHWNEYSRVDEFDITELLTKSKI